MFLICAQYYTYSKPGGNQPLPNYTFFPSVDWKTYPALCGVDILAADGGSSHFSAGMAGLGARMQGVCICPLLLISPPPILAIPNSHPPSAHPLSQNRYTQWHAVYTESPTRTGGHGQGARGLQRALHVLMGHHEITPIAIQGHRHSTRGGGQRPTVADAQQSSKPPTKNPLSHKPGGVLSLSSELHLQRSCCWPALRNGVKLSSLGVLSYERKMGSGSLTLMAPNLAHPGWGRHADPRYFLTS